MAVVLLLNDAGGVGGSRQQQKEHPALNRSNRPYLDADTGSVYPIEVEKIPDNRNMYWLGDVVTGRNG